MIIGNLVNGVVIDHIPAGRAMELYRLLKLDSLQCEIALIKNAASEKHGRKDILKIGQLDGIDFSILGYIDSEITINYIENGVRVRKFHPQLPDTIYDLIKCKNPRCITTTEQELPHVFRLTDPGTRTYRCVYCQTPAGR
ncbi:MAG: aspartate carbamoyltransferase regulatory subunit [Oscillospiraceae bacterium]|nr:aspartate carbamoyltransferase regulatory subunit [Oscillospiraceae bacterium]